MAQPDLFLIIEPWPVWGRKHHRAFRRVRRTISPRSAALWARNELKSAFPVARTRPYSRQDGFRAHKTATTAGTLV